MRTNLFRGLLAFAVLLTVSAMPAAAQSIMRGKVVDTQGKPVQGAIVSFQAEGEGANRKTTTRTDRNGDFIQVGLQSGAYVVTAVKEGEGAGTASTKARVTQSENPPVNLTLGQNLAPLAGGGGAPAVDDREVKAVQAAAATALEALKGGRWDEAITKFNEVVAKAPKCSDCYHNLGIAYVQKQDLAQAETAFNKANEIKPNAESYTALANLYTQQRKTDLAAQATQKATELAAASPGGASAGASYNLAASLFNTGKFAEAKTQLDAAVKTDPNFADAYYLLGMTHLNLGQIPDAVTALEKYLQLSPNGSKAAEVKQSLPALQAMVKK